MLKSRHSQVAATYAKWKRLRGRFYAGCGIAALLGGIIKMTLIDGPRAHNPLIPDDLHVYPLAVHGVGTVYLTGAEYQPERILMYLGLVLAFIVIITVGLDMYLSRKYDRTPKFFTVGLRESARPSTYVAD